MTTGYTSMQMRRQLLLRPRLQRQREGEHVHRLPFGGHRAAAHAVLRTRQSGPMPIFPSRISPSFVRSARVVRRSAAGERPLERRVYADGRRGGYMQMAATHLPKGSPLETSTLSVDEGGFSTERLCVADHAALQVRFCRFR